MEENVIQINGGITINVNVIVKNIMDVKKIIFGILLHVVVKIENTSRYPLKTHTPLNTTWKHFQPTNLVISAKW